MTGVLFRNGRRDSFVYPVHPAPRTAILVPWFHENAFESRPLRVFRDGWNEDAAAFAPAAVAGTFEQFTELARTGIPSLTHSIIVLWRASQPRLSEADRDTLWDAFRVPVFEQVIGKSGKRLAAECEAHDGLHIESPALPLENESVEDTPCPCGRKTPRIGVAQGVASERHIAAYAHNAVLRVPVAKARRQLNAPPASLPGISWSRARKSRAGRDAASGRPGLP